MNQTATIERSPQADATLALLWERIRRRGDMPGFTRAINAILASMRGEDERDFSMTQTVLSDPVLTQKVLRLANSGMYSAFGQRINTVSKAVLVLGTEAIGHLALGLKLIEELARVHARFAAGPHRDGKGRAGRDGGAAGRGRAPPRATRKKRWSARSCIRWAA
jgi:hypothetical protein